MHLKLEPNVGANSLVFGTMRNDIRKLLEGTDLITKSVEPENDFYETEGLILGYDEIEELEFIEIIKPSTVEFKNINFYSLSLSDCIDEMRKYGYIAEFDDGGYNFEAIGVALYCPQKILESVSIYRKGYYDDL